MCMLMAISRESLHADSNDAAVDLEAPDVKHLVTFIKGPKLTYKIKAINNQTSAELQIPAKRDLTSRFVVKANSKRL